MRVWNLYEPLAVRPANFGALEMMLATSLEPQHGQANAWVITLRNGVEFHNGKSVTPEDVIFSLKRIGVSARAWVARRSTGRGSTCAA